MASSVNAIITRFQRRFRGVEASYAATLFDDAHRKVLKKCEVRNTTRAITLTADTRQYDLSAAVYKIHEAYYERSATDWIPLYETSLEKLVTLRKGWRNGAVASTPSYYYITSAVSTDSAKGQIGFEPIPGTSTSGTYPRVVLYTTEYAALTGSETVPENLLDDNVYLDLMSEAFCLENEHEKYALYSAAAQKSLEANAQHVENLQANSPDFEIITPFTKGLSQVF